jgi:multidrug resistance efflux pump
MHTQKSRLASEEMLDILNETPHWVVRSGATVFLFIIALFVAGAWVIRYPEVLKGQAVISTEAPPIKIVAQAGRRVVRLLAHDAQLVKKGDVLAEMESATRLENIPVLKNLIRETGAFLEHPERSRIQLPSAPLTWGDLQEDIDALYKNYEDYRRLQSDPYHEVQAQQIRRQIVEMNQLEQVNKRRLGLFEQELQNAEDLYKTDEKLYAEQIYSKTEFKKQANRYFEKCGEREELQKAIITNKLKIVDAQKELQDFEYSLLEKKRASLDGVAKSLRNIENNLNNWQQHYLITAPADGKLVYLKQINVNQYIRQEETLFAVVPEQQTYVAVVDIPVLGMGKAGVGQKVILKLDDYPFQEYGALEGKILRVEPSLDVKSYRVVVELPKGLRSTYNQTFQCRSELAGTAEVITRDMRFIERIFYGIRKMLA